MHRTRFWVAAAGAALAMVCTAVAAFACIPIATLNLTPSEGSPGAEVTATMQQASKQGGPVTLHWKTADGPALATVTPSDAGLLATFKIPEDAAAGYNAVVATQERSPGVQTWGMPARALVHVLGAGGAAVNSQPPGALVPSRPAGLVSDSGPGTGLLAIVALVTAVAGLALAGMAAMVLGRGRPTAATIGR